MAAMYIRRVQEMDPPNPQYVISKLDSLVRQQAWETAALDIVDAADEHDWQKVEYIVSEAQRSGVETESAGTDYAYDFSDLDARREGDEYLMKTGIDALNQLIGGFKRSQYILLAGEYKGKKSWGMGHFGVAALRRGLKVLHISHENSKEETLARYDRMIGRLTKEKTSQDVEFQWWNPETGSLAAEVYRCESMYNIPEVATIRRGLRRHRGRLIVHKFPMYSASMLDIRSLVARLEAQRGFVPDVIINDYGDKMAPIDPRKNELQQKIETSMWHKRLADELNCIVFNATQIDTQSITRGRITKTSSYGNKAILGDCDIYLGLDPQTDSQKEYGETVLRVIGARGEKEGGVLTFWKCLDAGQFCIFSMLGTVGGGDEAVQVE